MFNVIVEWVDEDKSGARFSLPGRQEWRAEHLDALIQLLAEIRAEMTPPVVCTRSSSSLSQSAAIASSTFVIRVHVPSAAET